MAKFILAHQAARDRAKSAIDAAPAGFYVEIKEPTRNLEQSAKFHAMCGDLSKQREFAGKLRKPGQWKVLLISGHAMATKEGSEMVPGLEGEWCNIREETSKMSVRRMASLIEYTQAYGDNAGVIWTEPKIEPPEGYR